MGSGVAERKIGNDGMRGFFMGLGQTMVVGMDWASSLEVKTGGLSSCGLVDYGDV
ncbi:DUF445 domain-containing protein [Sesbania bispinosa]|nr:DUF445 domain-containing protein [Sesbania bispinosa]